MLYIAQNLRLLRNLQKLSQASLAKQIGVVPGTISNYENGTSKPDFDQLEKIIKILGVSAHDLLYEDLSTKNFNTKTPKNVVKENDHINDHNFDHKRKLQKTWSNGEGEIFKTKNKPQPVIYEIPPRVVPMLNDREVPYIAGHTVSVPVVHIEAAAGGGAFNLDFNEEEATETMVLPRSFLAPTNCLRYCIDVRGESMEPTLMDKTRIVIRLLDRSDWGSVRTGDVYVVTDREGATYVKRVRNRLKARGILVLLSDNPDRDRYHSFELEESRIQHIWAVELYIANRIPPVAQRFDSMRDELDALRDRLDEMELRLR